MLLKKNFEGSKKKPKDYFHTKADSHGDYLMPTQKMQNDRPLTQSLVNRDFSRLQKVYQAKPAIHKQDTLMSQNLILSRDMTPEAQRNSVETIQYKSFYQSAFDKQNYSKVKKQMHIPYP